MFKKFKEMQTYEYAKISKGNMIKSLLIGGIDDVLLITGVIVGMIVIEYIILAVRIHLGAV